jgi:hypothetical protein
MYRKVEATPWNVVMTTIAESSVCIDSCGECVVMPNQVRRAGLRNS